MKKIHIIIYIALCGILLPSTAAAQEEFRANDDFMFNHLSVGGSLGLNGIGIDVAMPATRHFTVHAGFSTLPLGALKLKIADNMGDIVSALNLPNQEFLEQNKDKTVEMAVAFNMYTAHFLVDYHPWRTSDFRITAGVMIGNNSVLHIYNTIDGSMAYLSECNRLTEDYNAAFGTTFPYSGLKFGDYVLTADSHGNVDAMMKVWVVRPYYGIGWGRDININMKRAVNVNFDIGLQHWGTPSFNFNKGEKKVSTSSKESGVFKFLSGLKAWPMIKLSISGEIF